MASSVNQNTNSGDASSMICRYYARGMCRFGNLCRFIHTESSSPPPPTQTSGASSSNAAAAVNIKPNDPNSWVMAPSFVPRYQQLPSSSTSDCIIPGSSNSRPTSSKKIALSATTTTTGDDPNKSYASVVMGAEGTAPRHDSSPDTFCPLNCSYGEHCVYEHNQLCEMCGRFCLHPTDKDQRKKHIAACIMQHEKDMELSFAVARSEGKTCGICFDIIMEKAGREQRFGILPNCNHIFCLGCIRKWRQAKQFDNKIIRACPECRIPSDYVCPSGFWVDTKDEKDKLIADYKNALGEKDCKYFKKGEGKCPFGNKCFYKHATANGERVDVGVPRRNKRKIQRAEDEILDLFDLYLWDFVDRREFHWLEILSNLSDSGDSDWSDELE